CRSRRKSSRRRSAETRPSGGDTAFRLAAYRRYPASPQHSGIGSPGSVVESRALPKRGERAGPGPTADRTKDVRLPEAENVRCAARAKVALSVAASPVNHK